VYCRSSNVLRSVLFLLYTIICVSRIKQITTDAFRHRHAAEPSRAHHALSEIGGGGIAPQISVEPPIFFRSKPSPLTLVLKMLASPEIWMDFRLCHHDSVSLFISPVNVEVLRRTPSVKYLRVFPSWRQTTPRGWLFRAFDISDSDNGPVRTITTRPRVKYVCAFCPRRQVCQTQISTWWRTTIRPRSTSDGWVYLWPIRAVRWRHCIVVHRLLSVSDKDYMYMCAFIWVTIVPSCTGYF